MQRDAPLRCQMRNPLVDVHIGLGAAASLPDHQWELRLPPSCPNFPADSGNGIRLRASQLARSCVSHSAGLFEIGKGFDDLFGLTLAADLKMFNTALCLRSPVVLCRHSDLAHGVVFHPGIHTIPHLSIFTIYYSENTP